MILSLRAGAKAYINGAVIKVDRRVNIQLLNDVSFLLDQHVLQPEDARTPLRQVYFAVQTALINPAGAEEARQMAGAMLLRSMHAVKTIAIASELPDVARLIEQERYFEAMKRLRGLFSIEDAIIAAPHGEKSDAPGREEIVA